jgi:1-acyl-sn-glycerol-3-phosphate acyltransferase
MSPVALLILTALLLATPRLLQVFPRLQTEAEAEEGGEIHGILLILWWVNRLYCLVWHRLRISGWAPLPPRGAAILIANHTSGVDNLLLQAGCWRVLGFMVAREFYEWPLIHRFCRLTRCIPVNRDGRDLAAIRAGLRALQEGRVVPIFPEGRIHPRSGRELGPIRPGAAFLAIRSGVPVIPAYIRGTPETSSVFKALLTPSRTFVVYGQPIDLSEFKPRDAGVKEVQEAVSDRFRTVLLELKSQAEAARRGGDAGGGDRERGDLG